MTATGFLTQRPRLSICPKVGQKYTTTSGLTTTTFARIFRITINFTTFRTVLGTFESTSGFWTVLPGYRFRFGAPSFLTESISCRPCAIYGDNAGQNKAKKSIPGALEAKPEGEIWRRPVFLTQRPRLSLCPKVGQSTQLLPVLQIHFRFHHGDILHAFFELRSISRHFGPFQALL